MQDDEHGTSYSHSESRDNDVTQGGYEVALPDGRLQQVSYKADKNGFNAEVKYQGEVTVQGPPSRPIRPSAPLPLENPAPVSPRAPQQQQFFQPPPEFSQPQAVPASFQPEFTSLTPSQREVPPPQQFNPPQQSFSQPQTAPFFSQPEAISFNHPHHPSAFSQDTFQPVKPHVSHLIL